MISVVIVASFGEEMPLLFVIIFCSIGCNSLVYSNPRLSYGVIGKICRWGEFFIDTDRVVVPTNRGLTDPIMALTNTFHSSILYIPGVTE
jgi:hypothetical protein